MDFLAAFEISASGMAVEKLRLETVAQNLANANVTSHPSSNTYQPLRVLASAKTTFNHVMQEVRAGVQVDSIQAMHGAPRLVFEPNHPHADEQGYVAFPNINPATEMLQLIEASRAYEANVQAFNAAKSMASRALEIGGDKS